MKVRDIHVADGFVFLVVLNHDIENILCKGLNFDSWTIFYVSCQKKVYLLLGVRETEWEVNRDSVSPLLWVKKSGGQIGHKLKKSVRVSIWGVHDGDHDWYTRLRPSNSVFKKEGNLYDCS